MELVTTTAISLAKILTNVGYIVDLVTGTRKLIFLGVVRENGVNKYGIFTIRDAFTANGTSFPKGWVFLYYVDDLEQKIKSGEIVLMSGVKELLNLGWNTELVNQYAGVNPQFLTNGSALVAGKVSYTTAEHGTMPAFATLLGADVTQEQVNTLLSLNNDILPNEDVPTLIFKSTTPTSNLANLSLDKAASPVDSVKALIADPVEFAKENPISTGVISVGIWDLAANFTGSFKPILFGKNAHLGIFGKGKRTVRRRR